jgi:hypothetical protein
MRSLKSRYFLLIFFTTFSLMRDYAFALPNPSDSVKFIAEAKLHYGFVISHHKTMQHLTTGHFPAFEINFGKQTHGEKSWQSLYNYPVMGIAYWYAGLADPEVLGSAHALYPYLNFHLYEKRCFELNFRFGAGLGYLTRKFDRLENYKDIAIGSHVNITINMFYEFKWMLLKKILASGGIGITHFSNGAFKTPNLGINIPTLNLGLAYIIHSEKKKDFNPDVNTLNKKMEIYAFLSGGMKEIYPAYGDKYGAFSLSASLLKPLSLKRKIGAGFDLFWEFSNIRNLKRNDIEVKHDYEVIKPGLHIGHQLEFSRLSFVTQLGFYLYAMDKSDGPVYTRIALRYKINKKLMANLAMKTHFAKADFVEWGIGYVFK